jgi:peptidoglycan/LPS O-acetylase OafA/YrhL
VRYRPEIDGLRAIALIPVVLFHAGLHPFTGGFVGVDIFFVISGYLITSIILDARHAGTFSLVEFYERRARRILPALFVVMLACTPVAWVLMLPDDFENFGQSVFATTLFSNNILLWLTSTYFGLQNEFKPLLHTWSLGIEEQFYVLYPLLLLAMRRHSERWAASILAVLLVASFAVAAWGAWEAPAAAFFLLPARAWQLLTGGLIACYFASSATSTFSAKPIGRLPAELAGLAGAGLILVSIFVFDSTTPYPGFAALMPTAGAALVILFATHDTLLARILRNRLLVGVGLISYSVYLWHQPLLAFQRISSLEEPGPGTLLLSIAGAFVLGAVTWKFVERPFRDRTFLSRSAVFTSAAAVGFVALFVGWQIHAHSGFVNRWPELAMTENTSRRRQLNAEYNQAPLRYQHVYFADPNKRHVFVIGNSYARDFINAALENGYFSNSEIAYSFAESCVEAKGQIDARVKLLVREADVVILGSPPFPLDCWKADWHTYESLGARRLIVIGEKNFGWNLNGVMRLPAAQRFSYRALILESVWLRNEEVSRYIPQANFVNVIQLLADADRRVPVFTEDRSLISQDTIHLTKAGAKFVGRILFEHPLLADLR